MGLDAGALSCTKEMEHQLHLKHSRDKKTQNGLRDGEKTEPGSGERVREGVASADPTRVWVRGLGWGGGRGPNGHPRALPSLLQTKQAARTTPNPPTLQKVILLNSRLNVGNVGGVFISAWNIPAYFDTPSVRGAAWKLWQGSSAMASLVPFRERGPAEVNDSGGRRRVHKSCFSKGPNVTPTARGQCAL